MLMMMQSFHFLQKPKKPIQIFYKSNRPILGVCLGAQLIASSFNKKVRKMSKPEFGITELKKTDDGREDPLFNNFQTLFHLWNA